MSTVLHINDLAVSDLTVIAIGECANAGEKLASHGATIRTVDSVDAAIAEAHQAGQDADVFLLDLTNGAAVEDVARLRDSAPDVGVLALVPEARSEELGRRALEAGALDFVAWPAPGVEFLLATTLLVGHNCRLQREVRMLRRRNESAPREELVGCSPVIRRLLGVLARAADSEVPILIEGASGVGKTLAARTIHDTGRRASHAFAVVDAEGLNVTAFERALEEAARGSLLLENIETLPAETQARLVRHLKERAPADGAATITGARLLATTSARLAELTARGGFREDLYYRLNVFPLILPSLSERREDISMLAEHFLRHSSQATGLPDQGFTPAAMILLESHPWVHNVSQLRNAIIRAHTLAAGGKIDRVHLLGPAIGLEPSKGMGVTPQDQLAANDADDDDPTEDDIRPFQEEEQRLLSRALRATKGNVRRAAQLLGIGRATLYRKIQVYKLRMR